MSTSIEHSTNKSDQGKHIFISYSNADEEFVEQLVTALHESGEELWFDKWEILAGDSIVQKIFSEGLTNADVFVVVLSANSVQSPWVREELDVATVRRIEGATRVIPVLIGDVEVPLALRALRRIDMRDHFQEGVRSIIEAAHNVSMKPPRTAESMAQKLDRSIAGLSQAATGIGLAIISTSETDSPNVRAFTGDEFAASFPLSAQAINDAVDELEEGGMVVARKAIGTRPYRFYQVEPTYVLYQEFRECLDYDPEADIRLVAAAVASDDQGIRGPELAAQTDLSVGRLNRAVDYLRDYEFVEYSQALGSFPYTFTWLRPNRRTRQLAGG